MTSTINARSHPNSMSSQLQGPQDLARTLRRIKRRLLLEQCGVALPQTLQNTQILARPRSGALPYALQNKPQVLLRSDSGDSAECIIGNNSKMPSTKTAGQRLRVLNTQVTPASPSME